MTNDNPTIRRVRPVTRMGGMRHYVIERRGDNGWTIEPTRPILSRDAADAELARLQNHDNARF